MYLIATGTAQTCPDFQSFHEEIEILKFPTLMIMVRLLTKQTLHIHILHHQHTSTVHSQRLKPRNLNEYT